MISARLAGLADSPELCRLFREVPLPGALSLAYARDPDFFTPLAIEGRTNQVPVMVDKVGISTSGIRSIRPVYIDGKPVNLGYLHGLRSRPGRNRFGRGFLFLKSLHEQDRLVPAYLMTVIADNKATRAMFEKNHTLFPQFRFYGTLVTHAIPLRAKPGRKKARSQVTIGSKELFPAMLRLLNDRFATRQFAPALDESDFSAMALLGLRPESFLVKQDGNRIAGMMGLWDQSAFKQCIVDGYHGWPGRFRPLVNVMLQLAGLQTLPNLGQEVKVVYGCFIAIQDDNPALLAELIDEACDRLAGNGSHYLITGLHERDPLIAAMNHRLCIRYRSIVYLGAWSDGTAFCEQVSKTRVPYLEACML